ncbi:hypothetical protein CLAFUW4_07398 [Fulvia fulva]|nr:hypothetical protein CLAFUR4_07405 [Fulvia fulva]WPV16079.1 hypothetical protein CLAFUW4_07398 [Fulvia fulva]
MPVRWDLLTVSSNDSKPSAGKKRDTKHTIKKEGQDRKCKTMGCENTAPVNGQFGFLCRACYKAKAANRQCATPFCSNSVPEGGITGDVCTTCVQDDKLGDTNIRKCVGKDCNKPTPQGGPGGNYCKQCYSKVRSAELKARSRVKAEVSASGRPICEFPDCDNAVPADTKASRRCVEHKGRRMPAASRSQKPKVEDDQPRSTVGELETGGSAVIVEAEEKSTLSNDMSTFLY